MSVQDTLKKVEELYTHNLAEHGTSSKAVGWNTEDCQTLRFDKLAYMVDGSAPYSVNDFGCGYGAQLQYLQGLGHEVSAYYGYDLSADMLAKASDVLRNTATDIHLFQHGNVDTKADYAFVSGTFNVRFESNNEAWETFIQDTLANLFAHSNKGVAFNMLTKYADWEEPHLYYGDPCFWFDYCKKHFTKHVAILHDYPLWEWTLVMRKDEAA